MESRLPALMLGVDFGPYRPISFRQSMYLFQTNKWIKPNPPVYPCCHQQSCLLTKDEHFLSSNITGLLSPLQKYSSGNTMEQKRSIREERHVLSGAMAQTIKRKVHGEKNWKLLSPPHFALSIWNPSLSLLGGLPVMELICRRLSEPQEFCQ